MAKNVKKIAELLGAELVGQVPDVGGGAFGAARLSRIVGTRLATVATWACREKVPMSETTFQKLTELARTASTPERIVSPMQVAAELLEDAVNHPRPVATPEEGRVP